MPSRNQIQKLLLDAAMMVVTKYQMGLKVTLKELSEGIFDCDEKDIDPYAKVSLNALIYDYDKYVATICKYLRGWMFVRLPDLTKAILIMSLIHHQIEPQLDKAVIINIAVKFSKTYGEDGDFKFINGVLENAI